MTSWTVMTPIPAYCGNRPTVTLANISKPIDHHNGDDDVDNVVDVDDNADIDDVIGNGEVLPIYPDQGLELHARRSQCNPRLLLLYISHFDVLADS